MKTVDLPMFRSKVVLIEGTSKEQRRKVNSLMKRYGCKLIDGTKTYEGEMGIHDNGRMIPLLPDEENPKTKGIIIFVIVINKGAIRYKISNNIRKEKMIGISHEIRHVVDRLLSSRKIKDTETPAYLTGYLSGEFLTEI